MSKSLSPELISSIKLRIQDPRRRSAMSKGEPAGIVTDPDQLAQLFDVGDPGSPNPFRLVAEQMERWGQKMPPMYVTQHEDGSLGASSENPNNRSLALPATKADFKLLEEKVGRPLPHDLRQLYSIADGGFGPGIGPGLYSLERIGQEYDDLCRRGPGYTGEADWPPHLLPLTDIVGPVSYDLERGVIVAFNEYYYDDGLTIDKAFTDLHPSLEGWLTDWLDTTG